MHMKDSLARNIKPRVINGTERKREGGGGRGRERGDEEQFLIVKRDVSLVTFAQLEKAPVPRSTRPAVALRATPGLY